MLFCSFFIYLAVMGGWIAPRFFTNFTIVPRVISSPEVKDAFHRPALLLPQMVLVRYNSMLDVFVIVNALPKEDGRAQLYIQRAEASLRVDNFILYTGTWLGITLTLTYLVPFPRILSVSKLPATSDWPKESPKKSTEVTAEDFLAADVSSALNQARELYSRSTLMLAGGVIMAFIGVGIFYVSFPQFQAGEDRWTYLEKGIRPTGMLIFVEGIAWFLLRQYRALMEDYKAFHHLYLKRANYLIALKTLSASGISPPQMFLAASMISEDLTGRLKRGETTETLEGVRATEPNPVFTLLRSLVDTVKQK